MDKEIAILGGSFNPPHLGHRMLAEKIVSSKSVSKLIIIPINNNPLKVNHKRLDCLSRLVVATFQGIRETKIDWFNFYNKKVAYTIEDLTRLRSVYDIKYKLVLYIGSDLWGSFGEWKKADEIINLAKVVVVERVGWEIDKKRKKANSPNVMRWGIPKISSQELVSKPKDINFWSKYIVNEAFSILDKERREYI
ncbi:MAG: hypothetical protein JJV97_03910 [SAR324 cluster bacterium]|nr:hypothetical protein [SAR324 cluster bacterium]